jgi:hypothetical protein
MDFQISEFVVGLMFFFDDLEEFTLLILLSGWYLILSCVTFYQQVF